MATLEYGQCTIISDIYKGFKVECSFSVSNDTRKLNLIKEKVCG